MIKKKMKKLIPVFVCIILIIICGLMARGMILMNDELKELKKNSVQTESLREEVKKISKYSAYEVNYTSILYFSDKAEIEKLNIKDIPLTGNRFVATIDGKMNIGINGELIVFEEEKDIEGNVTAINLRVPHSEILENYTIQESLKVYDQKNGIFNPVSPKDTNALEIEALNKEKKKVLDSDVLQRSDESIKYLLTTHFQTVYGEDVVVNYEYIEE